MSITVRVIDDIQNQIRNTWKFPPSCPADRYPDDIVPRTISYRHWAEYVPEHRPFPSDLTRNLTSRELVYRRQGVSPLIWYESSTPCPHDGVHGVIKGFHYLTGGSTLFQNLLYDADELSSQLMWASKLREKIGDLRYNLGSSLAEYRETAKMFVKTAESLHDAYKVLRGRMTRRKLRACSVPAAVLQYNFGVAPLVEDLYSSAEILRHRLDLPIHQRFSVGVTKHFAGDFDFGNYHYIAKGTFSERATVYCTVIPSQMLSTQFDFGNPAEWAWELIPFSFVVDWAIPIGQWLGDLDALIGISDIRGTVTRKTQDVMRYRASSSSPYPITGQDGTANFATYKRDVIGSIPMPPLPKWSPSLSGKRAINAVSLLLGLSSTCRKGK